MAARVSAHAEKIPAAAPAVDVVGDVVGGAVAGASGKTPRALVQRVLARDNRRCRNCRKMLYLHVHHIMFRSMGGRSEQANLLALCSLCHTMIHRGLLSLHADGRGGYVFLDRSGAPVEGRSVPKISKVFSEMPRTAGQKLFKTLTILGGRHELMTPFEGLPRLGPR